MREAPELRNRHQRETTIDMPGSSSDAPTEEEGQNMTQTFLRQKQIKHIKWYLEVAMTAVLGSLIQLFGMISQQEHANYKIFLPQIIPLIAICIFMYYMRLEVCDGSFEAPVPYCSAQTRKKIADIGIYGSNLILMVAPLVLLCVHTAAYAILAFIPFLALLVIISLFRQGCRSENYQQVSDNLDHFMKLSTGAALPAFTGVLGFVSNPPLLKHSLGIKVSECFLYCTVVICLLVMLLTSVPPRTPNLVDVLKSMCNTLLALLMLAVLMATSEILKGFAVVAIYVHITGAAIWLIQELRHHDENRRSASGARPEHNESAQDQDAWSQQDEEVLLLTVATSTFGVIFYFYSNYVHYRDKYTRVQHILLLVCMTVLCSTFISCLSRMLIIYNSADTRAWTSAKGISYYITHYSVICLLFVLLGCLLVYLMAG